MFHNYHVGEDFTGDEYTKANQRRIAVEAAYEIAKASVGKSVSSENHHQTKSDLKDVAEQISELADAIQKALVIK